MKRPKLRWLPVVLFLWMTTNYAASGPRLTRRNFLFAATAAAVASSLPHELGNGLAVRPQIIDPIFLNRLSTPVFFKPLSKEEIKWILKATLKAENLTAEQLYTDEAFEKLLELNEAGGARQFLKGVRQLLPHYTGQPMTLDELRFHLEGTPLPEAQPNTVAAARSQFLIQLRKELLSSCAYFISPPEVQFRIEQDVFGLKIEFNGQSELRERR